MSHKTFHSLMKTVPDRRIELLADVGHCRSDKPTVVFLRRWPTHASNLKCFCRTHHWMNEIDSATNRGDRGDTRSPPGHFGAVTPRRRAKSLTSSTLS